MKKKISIFGLSFFMLLGLTGCVEFSEDMPEVLQRAYLRAECGMTQSNNVIYLDDEKSEVAEKCLDYIEYQGYVFALPMNVKDLPDELRIEKIDDYQLTEFNLYNGYMLTSCYVMKDEHWLLSVEVFHKTGEDVEQGQIVSMSFSDAYAYPNFGNIITDKTSLKEIKALFGDFLGKDDYNYCKYVLKDGRVIEVVQTCTDELPPTGIYLYMDSGR